MKIQSIEESSEEDDEMDYLVKNFTRFMKYEKEKSRHEPKKKKMMKKPQRVQSSNKRGSSSKKAYAATWSDEDSTEEEEVAHICFMALQEGEVTSNSSNSNSYTFDELQDVGTSYVKSRRNGIVKFLSPTRDPCTNTENRRKS
ncbi:hypothetical protein GQ457_08G021930 [Hibiscus cannabinus]